jgi:lipopolysaccharide exporter
MAEDDNSDRIGARTLRGVAWAYSSYFGGRAVVLVATAILARLLTPEDFGVVGFALVFLALLDTLKDLGISQALVAGPREKLYERADTVFVTNVLLGVALSVFVAAMSPLVAAFFDESQLRLIVPILGLNAAIRSLGWTHYAIAQKELNFRARTIAEYCEVFARGSVGVGLAIAGAGVWSLVFGYLAGTTAMVIALWILISWRPRLRWRREQLPGLLRFGGAITGVDITSAVSNNIDYLLVGKVLGPTALGIYTLAFRLPELIVLNVATVTSVVLFPAFANVPRESLSHAFLVAFRYTIMVCLPIAAGIAVLADPLVLALFGSKWHAAIEPMRVLAAYAFAATVAIPAGTVYKAVGRADVVLKLAIPWAALFVVARAIFVDQGITAVAACHAAVSGLFAAISIFLATRLLSVEVSGLARAVAAPLVATLGLAAVAGAAALLIDSPWPALLVGSVLGGAVYVGLLWLLMPEALRDVRDKLRSAAPLPPGEPPVVRETDVVA